MADADVAEEPGGSRPVKEKRKVWRAVLVQCKLADIRNVSRASRQLLLYSSSTTQL